MQDIQNKGKYGKYSVLIAISGLLLVITIFLAILTFYSAGKFAGATQELELANRQIAHVKSISQQMLSLHAAYNSGMANATPEEIEAGAMSLSQPMKNTIDDIKRKKEEVNTWFPILLDGGTIQVGTHEVYLDGTDDPDLRTDLLKAQEQWMAYDAFLTKIINEAVNKNAISDMNRVSNKVGNYGLGTSESLTTYYNHLNDIIRTRAVLLRYVQGGGILLALGLFLAFVFGALRQLTRGDALLEASRQEMREIMKTVNTGLFLLDKKLNIGSQHSEALVDIVGTDKLAGESFATILRNRISEKDLRTTEEFVEQLYNPRVKEKLVNSLNPLHKVIFNDGKSNSRYLDFNFSRVYEGKEIARILVNVEDVSEQVRLEQRLEKERAQNDRQVEMLTTILNVSPKVINEFIANTHMRIEKMNNVLKSPGGSQFELESKLRGIYREMHSLKGEASALKLHSFTAIASQAEDKLYALQNQGKLSGDDFLSLTVQLDELLNLSNTIRGLGERINSTVKTVSHQAGTQEDLLFEDNEIDEFAQYLVEFGRDIAKRQGKQIEVDVSKTKGVVVPERLMPIIKEVSIQLLRNAIVHGIADGETRLKNGKSPTGKVTISFVNNSGANQDYFVFVIEDDGRGIDYDAIRQTLINSKAYTAEKADELNENQLLGILFSSGFSTKTIADEDGGRGVGLDIVKERIRQYQGKINVQSEKGQYARFIIKLPIKGV